MNIKRIGNIILEVKDLENSIKFYHEILGMPIKNERRNWVDLGQQSGGILSLHPASITTSHTGPSKENGILIGLTVGEIYIRPWKSCLLQKSKYLETFKKDKQVKML